MAQVCGASPTVPVAWRRFPEGSHAACQPCHACPLRFDLVGRKRGIRLHPKQIQDHFTAAHQGCKVSAPPGQTGLVNGFRKPVTLIVLTLEGCAGAQPMTADLVLVYDNGGRIGVIDGKVTSGQVENARLVGDRIVVGMLEFGPDNPRCCPSRRANHQVIVSGNRLALVR